MSLVIPVIALIEVARGPSVLAIAILHIVTILTFIVNDDFLATTILSQLPFLPPTFALLLAIFEITLVDCSRRPKVFTTAPRLAITILT